MLTLAGCSKKKTNAPAPAGPAPRTFVMGFSPFGPNFDYPTQLATIGLWTARADAAILSYEVPWDSLLSGARADSVVFRNLLPQSQYFRGRGMKVVVMVDPANGLDRAGEATALVAAGRSMGEPAIQMLYRRYVVAADTPLRPDYLGLALETNLIRGLAPAPLYAAVKQMANDAAADVRAVDAVVPLLVSVQVDAAWGFMPGGTFVGVAQDFADFPFLQVLGLSSYPYLAGFAAPEDLPLDYYSRLVQATSRPVLVTEGGWSSTTVSPVATTPAMQRRYPVRQAQLLDQVTALGWFQLTFTDLDLAVWPPGVTPFACLGLVDVALRPKPALSAWDSVFARPRR